MGSFTFWNNRSNKASTYLRLVEFDNAALKNIKTLPEVINIISEDVKKYNE